MTTETGSLYEFGVFRIDPARRLLLREAQPVPLTPKVFETLLILVESGDKVVRKDELMNALWPDKFVEEANLSQNIFVLRKALGERSHDHRYILTVPGAGYRFAAPVTKIACDTTDERDLSTANTSPTIPVSLAQNRPRAVTAIVAASAIILAALSLSEYLGRFFHRQPPQKPQVQAGVFATQRRPSLMIVGFQNVSGRQQDAWLSTAFSEMLSTELAAGEALRITDLQDSSQPSSQLERIDLATLQRDKLAKLRQGVGSDLLVSGSYAVIGGELHHEVRLDLKIQDTRSGERIAQIAETAPEANLFDLVSRVGTRLRQKLQISDLSPTEAALVRASLPANTQGIELYSEGLQKLRVFDALGARDLLLRAIAIDRGYPLAHAALADARSALGYDQKARDEATQAFQLSAHLSREDRLLVEGRYRTTLRDWAKAIEAYQTLFTLFPDNIDYGLHLAAVQSSGARPRDALATLNALRQLPPPAGDDPRIDLEESRAWNTIGDFKHMELALTSAAQRARARQAQLVLARARNQQCWVLRFLARQTEAVDACLEAQHIYEAEGDRGGTAETLRVLGDAVSGSDAERAISLYRQSLAVQRSIGHLAGEAIVLNELAIQYSVRGDHGAAMQLFEQAHNIFRQIGNSVSASGLLINIGYEFQLQGRLAESLKMYRKAVTAGKNLGNEDIEGIAESNIGVVQQLQGDLQNAKKTLEDALVFLQAVGDQSLTASAMNSLGEVVAAQGDLERARKLEEKALAIRQAARENVPLAETQVDLAELSLGTGRSPAELETSLRNAIDTFRSGKNVDDEVKAQTLLAHLLSSTGKSADALTSIQRTDSILSKADPSYRLAAAVEAARVRRTLAGDATSEKRAARTLKSAILQANRYGFVGIELEARLALAEAELNSLGESGPRNRLEALEQDAQRRGFAIIASKAAALMSSFSKQSASTDSSRSLR